MSASGTNPRELHYCTVADQADFNCLKSQGGPACGEPYVCTYVAPAADKAATSGAASAGLSAAAAFAAVAAAL